MRARGNSQGIPCWLTIVTAQSARPRRRPGKAGSRNRRPGRIRSDDERVRIFHEHGLPLPDDTHLAEHKHNLPLCRLVVSSSHYSAFDKGVPFPDDIKSLAQSSVSLIEGDFTTALKAHEGTYDALVSHFFIDTATNILTYLETMHAMLKPGGLWINFGPLLYGTMPALQLSLDEVIAMAESIGFELEQPSDACGKVMEFDSRVRGAYVAYASDVESLSRNAYLAQHWIARKKV
ncbi:hypothetical protein Q7P37_002672 [Cladosporium fusiforme]